MRAALRRRREGSKEEEEDPHIHTQTKKQNNPERARVVGRGEECGGRRERKGLEEEEAVKKDK